MPEIAKLADVLKKQDIDWKKVKKEFESIIGSVLKGEIDIRNAEKVILKAMGDADPNLKEIVLLSFLCLMIYGVVMDGLMMISFD